MQSDRHITARYWLETATQDLLVADEYTKRLPHVACFHAQQGAEKALKAVLTEIIGDAPRTHVAYQLIQELTETNAVMPEDIADAARGLDKFYAPTRYPDALGGVNPLHAFSISDATNACAAARSVIAWCSKQLEEGDT
jgi:HEPN domain-containing protein